MTQAKQSLLWPIERFAEPVPKASKAITNALTKSWLCSILLCMVAGTITLRTQEWHSWSELSKQAFHIWSSLLSLSIPAVCLCFVLIS